MSVLVNEHVERTLKYQILISSLILTPLLWIAAYITLPPDGFKIPSALSV